MRRFRLDVDEIELRALEEETESEGRKSFCAFAIPGICKLSFVCRMLLGSATLAASELLALADTVLKVENDDSETHLKN